MNARDLFGLALRLACLFLFIWGIWYMLAALNNLISLALALSPVAVNLEKSFSYFVYGFPAFLSGLIGLRFADTFVNFTYRRDVSKVLAPPVVASSVPPKIDSVPPAL